MTLRIGLMAGFAAMSLAASAGAQTPAQLEANKKLVLEFYRNAWEPQRIEAAKDYVGVDMIEHNPTAKAGLAGFVETFGPRWKPKPVQATLQSPPAIVMAEGDLVTLIFKRMRPEPSDPARTYEAWWFDTFRIKDGKFVEHWDPATKPAAAPPRP